MPTPISSDSTQIDLVQLIHTQEDFDISLGQKPEGDISAEIGFSEKTGASFLPGRSSSVCLVTYEPKKYEYKDSNGIQHVVSGPFVIPMTNCFSGRTIPTALRSSDEIRTQISDLNLKATPVVLHPNTESSATFYVSAKDSSVFADLLGKAASVRVHDLDSDQ